MGFRCISALWICLLAASVAAGEPYPEPALESYWSGIASFRSLTTAERVRDEIQHHFATALVIRRVSTANGEFFRLLSGPYGEKAAAHSAVDKARGAGYESAWLVVEPRLARGAEVPAPAADAAPGVVVSDKPADGSPLQPAAVDAEVHKDVHTSETMAPDQPLYVDVQQGASIKLTRIDTAATPIKIDGFVDEPVWQQVPVIDDFVTLEPDTLVPGKYPTHMRVAYSERGMYVSAVMQQPVESLIRRLSGRDVRDNRDSFSVTIDTSGEGRYGFWFGINLGDALMDGTVLPERVFTNDWDGPWYGRSQKTDNGWSMEMFIPWGIVSMPASSATRNVGLYVSRKVAFIDERWGWPALPPTQPKFMSALQKLEMQDVQPGQQYNIYPFASTAFDFVDHEPDYRVGADLFWRPSTNFQMNATINPDFGNVESDEVVINLTATETFFPEKRLFFLEGQEIFVASPRADTRGRGVGMRGAPYTMVNTRRIGGQPREPDVPDTIDIPQRELLQPTELLGAVKTTGQIGRVRYGLMGAFEDEVKFDVENFAVSPQGAPENLHQDGNDYGIARVLYEDNQGGAYRALGFLSTAVLNPQRDAMVNGLDFHYLTPRGNFKVDGQLMNSDIDGEETGFGGFVDFEMNYGQGRVHRVGLEYFDEHIDINDLGFLQRNDEYRIRSSFQWTKSDLSWARENQFDVRGFVQRNVTENLFTGASISFSNRTNLNDLSQLIARLSYAPSYFDDLNSFGNGTYRIEDQITSELSWQTDTAKPWSFKFGVGYDEENLSDGSYNASVGVFWRPTDQFAVEFETKYISSDGWLLHQEDDLFATFETQQWQPKLSVEYFISARQQLRLSMQWVGIRAEESEFFLVPASPGELIPIDKPVGPGFDDNYDFSVSQYSMQLRYRWEIAPLSDIFVVYTRLANLREALQDRSFNRVFNSAWRDPLADFLVFKIRYRFGS